MEKQTGFLDLTDTWTIYKSSTFNFNDKEIAEKGNERRDDGTEGKESIEERIFTGIS